MEKFTKITFVNSASTLLHAVFNCNALTQYTPIIKKELITKIDIVKNRIHIYS